MNRSQKKSVPKKATLRKPPFLFEKELSESQVLRIARSCTQSLKPYVPGRSIEEVRERYGVKSVTKLGSNENPLGANPKVIKAVTAIMPKVFLYPDGSSRDLRQTLAHHFQVTLEMVMCGNGSDEILLNLALAFVNPGETILVSEHTFSEYEFSGRVADALIIKIPMRDMRYDLAGFKAALKLRPKLVYLCNPNNPTGTWFTQDELADFLAATSSETLVVIDEAYAEFAEDPAFPNSLELLSRYPNLVISRTMSKLYGLAGMRLGYGIAHPNVIRECQRVKTPFNVNLLVQTAATCALEDKGFVTKSLKVNREGRTFLMQGLKRLKLKALPTQANFICFEVPRPAVDICEELLQRGMIVRALRSFGFENWVRVTIGTPAQNKRFLKDLKFVLG